MATGKYSSTRQTTNLARVARMVVGPCTEVLRAVLMKRISPPDLKKKLDQFLADDSKQNMFFKPFKREIDSENYSNFDINLLYMILRHLASLPPPGKGWGNKPDPSDRSVSANIERIRLLRNKYVAHVSDVSFSSSDFNKITENIIKVIKELETYLGMLTDNQDDILKLKSCTMDSMIEQIYIEKIPSEDETDSETIQGSKRSGLQKIRSEELIELLSSFKVKCPEDYQKKSLVRKILHEDLLQEFEDTIKSLSDGVMLTKSIARRINTQESTEVLMFEVDVFCDRDKLEVLRKDAFQDFFDFEKNNTPRVILIRSKCIPVVEAKLEVYRRYRNCINRGNIFLQHEYEDFDELAKFSAYKKLSSFCCYVELVVNTFTTDLQKTLKESHGKKFTSHLCSNVFKHIQAIQYKSTRIKKDLGTLIADEIHKRMSKTNPMLDDAVLIGIHEICRKTVEDLKVVLGELEEFQQKVVPISQNKLFKDWCKRDFIPDRSSFLKNYPSVIKFMIGHRGDKKPVLKVYLRNDDKNAELFFKNCCSNDTLIECVNKKTKEMLDKIKTIRLYEEEAPAIDTHTIKQLKKIIEDNGEKIYARYSNVVGLQISNVRCVGGIKKEEPCIVLYCLDKTIIPYGEHPLPESLEGWPCDIREDIVMLGSRRCPTNCPFPEQNFPELGCSIGRPLSDESGSVGFFYKSTNPRNRFKRGFFTASHVAVAGFEDLYDKSHLSKNRHQFPSDLKIVHPSWEDYKIGNRDNTIGVVVESFLGNMSCRSSETNKSGLDFAVVESNTCIEKETEILPIAKDIKRGNVTKTGRTTGTTNGRLTGDSLSIRVDKSFTTNGYMFMSFYNCYSVTDEGNVTFFSPGDSGSGVFVVKGDGTLGPLGIAFASMNSQTVVCKIDAIVNELQLAIVNKQTRMEEEMDWSPTNPSGKKRKHEETMILRSASPKRKKRKM